jgi:DNA-binding XRE family transcriptional regulator
MSRTTEIDAQIGRNVRVLRAYWQYDQKTVAKAMHDQHPTWTRQTVSEVERGLRAVLVSEAYGLAAVFHTTLARLLSENPLWPT